VGRSPGGGREPNYPYNHTTEREPKGGIIKDALKSPYKYVGCRLCFGRGSLCDLVDDMGRSMGKVTCPECHGDGITLSQLMQDTKFLGENK